MAGLAQELLLLPFLLLLSSSGLGVVIIDVGGNLHVSHARGGDLLVARAVDCHLAILTGISLTDQNKNVELRIFLHSCQTP